jgi:hypothetical protein
MHRKLTLLPDKLEIDGKGCPYQPRLRIISAIDKSIADQELEG